MSEVGPGFIGMGKNPLRVLSLSFFRFLRYIPISYLLAIALCDGEFSP